MSLAEVIKTALDEIQYIARTETIVGEPITVGGVTLIPISKISVGFAAGGAGKEPKTGSGAGTGGGITVTPVGFITVIGEKVKMVPIGKDEIDFGKLLAMTPEAVKKVQQFMNKKEEKKKQRAKDEKKSSDKKE
jgi:uncharacterized spore protein YtfJ